MNIPRADKPCDLYAGNVCTGFGGSTNCPGCGWDMFDHAEFQEDFDEHS